MICYTPTDSGEIGLLPVAGQNLERLCSTIGRLPEKSDFASPLADVKDIPMRAIPTLDITPAAVPVATIPLELPKAGLWFLLHTKSRQEKILADELHRMGIPNYLPLSRHSRHYGKRRIRVDLPLFPGYLFVRGTVADAYQSNRTHRVARIIPVTDQSRLDWELRNLFLACRNGPTVQPYPYLQRGVQVQVCSGPFRGVEGLIEDRTSTRRLILQVQMLGRAVSIEVDGDVLQLV